MYNLDDEASLKIVYLLAKQVTRCKTHLFYPGLYPVLKNKWDASRTLPCLVNYPRYFRVTTKKERDFSKGLWTYWSSRTINRICDQSLGHGPFTLCDLQLRFAFSYNGLHRSWWSCHSCILWTLPLSPVQPICCDKKNRSRNKKKNVQCEWGFRILISLPILFSSWKTDFRKKR